MKTLLLVALLCASLSAIAATEQRCTELGAACICAEQLNTPTYTNLGGGLWNPDDSSTKQCTTGGTAGGFLQGDAFEMQVATSGVLFTALPNLDSSITRLARLPDGGGQHTFFMGHVFDDANPTGRRSLRWYQYWSTDYEFSEGSASCLNAGKIWEVGTSGGGNLVLIGSQANGVHMMYGWDGGNPPSSYGWNVSPLDCCSGTIGPNQVSFDTSTMGGKWWRFELAIDNVTPSGATTVIRMWRRNITDDLAEEVVFDTTVPTDMISGDDWTSTHATTLKPTTILRMLAGVPWRNGTCDGWNGFTHYLAAAWATAEGQRIGAAVEVEGGATDPQPEPVSRDMNDVWVMRTTAITVFFVALLWGIYGAGLRRRSNHRARVAVDRARQEVA